MRRCQNGHEVPDQFDWELCPVCREMLGPTGGSSAAAGFGSSPAEGPSRHERPPSERPRWRRPLPADWSAVRGRRAAGISAGAVAVIVGLLVIGIVTGSRGGGPSTRTHRSGGVTGTAKPGPGRSSASRPMGYGQILEGELTPRTAAAGSCGDLRAAIGGWETKAQRILAAETPADADPYSAAAYVASHVVPTGGRAAYRRALLRVANTRLKALTRSPPTPTMVQRYLEDSLVVCSLTRAYARAAATIGTADRVSQHVRTAAANVPWYPRGYRAYDENIAWKWDNLQTCEDESVAGCWQMSVLSKDGCPNSLSAEIDIEDVNDTVVDSSSDTLGPLARGTVGELSFETFRASDHARLTKIDCY
jgi:hypothetical protein